MFLRFPWVGPNSILLLLGPGDFELIDFFYINIDLTVFQDCLIILNWRKFLFYVLWVSDWFWLKNDSFVDYGLNAPLFWLVAFFRFVLEILGFSLVFLYGLAFLWRYLGFIGLLLLPHLKWPKLSKIGFFW